MTDLIDKVSEKLSRENLLFILTLIPAIWALIEINEKEYLMKGIVTTLLNIWIWSNLPQLSIFHLILGYVAYLILKIILKTVFIRLIYENPNDIDLNMENNDRHSYARLNGTVTKINKKDAKGSWRFEYNKYLGIYELDIQTEERRAFNIINRRLETLGSRSGFWEDEKTFIHVAEMYESIKGDKYVVYVFAWGNAETFEAAILPDTTENEEIYAGFLDLHTTELLDNVKNVRELSADIIYGETSRHYFGRT